MDGKVLLTYACEKFEDGKYEEALEAFVLAYGKGYEREWIIENIYRCYMEANEWEFRKTFEKNNQYVEISYDACWIDFIPYRNGEYYIFDRERKIFCGIFSIWELQDTEAEPLIQKMEFSSIALDLDWNWNCQKKILVAAKERKIYAVCQDLERSLSFYKIPELSTYMENVIFFSNQQKFHEYFHQHTSVYLPKLFYGLNGRDKLLEIVEREHNYRITPEGRNTENVLLTIGIPTHNRGNLLLQRLENLRMMYYDAEIEIAISKNGIHYYQEEYIRASKIEDARINYVGFDEELTMSKNWQNVVKIANGDFVLLISDEDDVILDALEHYLNFLNNHRELSLLRAGGTKQYASLEDKYFKRGKEAFLGGFLTQNYLSGLIFHRKKFMDAHMEQWDLKYGDNLFYHLYPHAWWQAVLSFWGDYAEDAQCLVYEGDSILIEEISRYRKDNVEGMQDVLCEEVETIAAISEYGSRLEQFMAGIELINDFKNLDLELKKQAFFRFVDKTYFLMDMVKNDYHYKEDEFPEYVRKLKELSITAMNKLGFSHEGK